MDTIMKPGEEVTGNIRWEQPVLTLWGYIAGETRVHTFQIHCPSDGHGDWTLTSSLPGQHEWRLYCDGPDALRKAAEGWVGEFVASLGAVFPEEPDESAAFQVSEARDLLDKWDRERAVDGGYGTERTLADQVRNLLAIVDQVAASPAAGEEGP